jgi:hypothetical protein
VKIVSIEMAPADDLAYEFEHDLWNALASDTIASAAVSGVTSGLTVGTPDVTGDKAVAIAVTAPAAVGTYRFTYRVTTVGAQAFSVYVVVTVRVPW